MTGRTFSCGKNSARIVKKIVEKLWNYFAKIVKKNCWKTFFFNCEKNWEKICAKTNEKKCVKIVEKIVEKIGDLYIEKWLNNEGDWLSFL